MLLNLYLDYNGRNKFSLQLSPTLNFVKYMSHEERQVSHLLYVYNLDINFTTLKVPLLVKYSLYSSNKKMYPYFKMGPGYTFYLNQKGNYEYYSVPVNNPSNPTDVFNKPLNEVTKTTRVHFVTGAGMDIKLGKRILSLGAIYSFGEGQLDGYRSDFQFQMEYQF